MRRRSGVKRCRGRDSDGAIMVMMAAILPVAILFLGFVIDVANWFEHDRHLQTQADAAALAGGISFGSCPNNTPIHDKVDEYSGQTWNSQVDGTQGNVHVLVNSSTYYNQPTKTDSTVVQGEPCTAKMVDVKVTETDLPWWFALGSVDFLNAHARVEPKPVGTMAGGTPLGVPDVKPEKVAVTFVDEDKAPGATGRDLGTTELTRKTYANGVAIWDNVGVPVTVKMENPHIGMRVALSGSKTTTTCGQPLVECYQANTNNHGILYVRGYTNDTGTATAPKLRDVKLIPDAGGSGEPACQNAYFSSPNTTCGVAVQATLNFGGAVPNGTTVEASFGNQKRSLTLVNAAQGTWQTSTGNNGPISVPAAGGEVPITLSWKRQGNGGDFGVVHRVFSANADSGPIKLAQINENGVGPANSFQTCAGCTKQLTVQLGIQGSFQDLYSDSTQVTTPVTLRFAGGVSGSQNQALDCDPWADPVGGNRGFEEEIAYGCRPAYTFNVDTACPSSPQTLWGTSTSPANQGDAWQCTAVETGDKTGQIGPGMNLRVLGSKNPSTCPTASRNFWPNFDEVTDKRVIDLFITQFGAFAGSGQNTVAVTDFATFYVTGWRGNGNADKNPCQDQTLSNHDDLVAESGTIVGHFFHYTGPIEGTPGTGTCDFNSPTPCMPALTQ